MSNFTLYVLGYLIVIAGLAYGAHLLGVPPVWIGVGAIVLAGIGIVTGVSPPPGGAAGRARPPAAT